jgi:hypothetical protein
MTGVFDTARSAFADVESMLFGLRDQTMSHGAISTMGGAAATLAGQSQLMRYGERLNPNYLGRYRRLSRVV